jgi:hypothetical protein
MQIKLKLMVLLQRISHSVSSNPQLIHHHVECIKLHCRRMPLEMLPDLQNILMHSCILCRCDLFQGFLQQWYVEMRNHNCEFAPVENVSKWQIIVVGNHHWYTSVEHCISQPRRVHLVSFDVQTELAGEQTLGVGECDFAFVDEDFIVVSPFLVKL